MRVGDERRAEQAVAGRKAQEVAGTAGVVKEFDRLLRDDRRLRRGLGDDAIARDERGGDLADEDRQGEVPWRNTDENAAPMPTQGIFFAGQAGQGRSGRLQSLRRIVAAEVGGLAGFAHRVVKRLARLALQKGDQRAAPRLDGVGGAQKHLGALRHGRRAPAGKGFIRDAHGLRGHRGVERRELSKRLRLNLSKRLRLGRDGRS